VKRKAKPTADLSPEECRLLIVRNFDLLVHDLSCPCDAADKGRAWDMLLLSGWTTTEAFTAWQNALFAGEFRA